MKQSDTEIKQRGFRALAAKLGMVDAERFISLIQREKFDYTQWQNELFEGLPLKQISSAAMKARKKNYEN